MMTGAATTTADILSEAYWREAFACPEARPLARLLLDWPTMDAIRALPVAAAAFPAFPIETRPLSEGTRPSAFASWKREGTHAFSTWSCEEVVRREVTGGGGMGRAIGNYYHHILPERRRPYALLWRDVRQLLIPAAASRLAKGDAFAAASLGMLDRIIAQQGFRDLLFMSEVQDILAGGDKDRLLMLLPRSREELVAVRYRPVRGPHQVCWEGYLPHELV